MSIWRKSILGIVGAMSLAAAGTLTVGADAGGNQFVEFDSMTPVTGSAVGAVNDRGIKGGGLPWVITSAHGWVHADGHVDVNVKGLIIVVPPVNGKNPVPFFKATVSCITPSGVKNVSTGNFEASSTGDAEINGTVALPSQCADPIVFVAAPSGQWFAESNPDD
jgi:hypothetical protein